MAKKGPGWTLFLVNTLIVVLMSILITALSGGLYVDTLELIVNNSYFENVTRTISEPYNVTNVIPTTEEYTVLEEYTEENINLTKVWFTKLGQPLKDIMISNPRQGYWSGLVGICPISLNMYNPNFVKINFTVSFLATQIDTKQGISRIVPLEITADLDPLEENVFTQIITAGEYPDHQGVLANWTFGTCDFRSLVSIEYIENNETYYELEERKYNVTKIRNVTKTRALPLEVINSQPKYVTEYKDREVVVSELVQKYDRITRKEMRFWKFILVTILSICVSIGIVFLINRVFIMARHAIRKRSEDKGILVVKGTKLKLKR